MTIEYGILAFFMGLGAILIGALIAWYIINYNEIKEKKRNNSRWS